jgi:effector-binding domain-containing protein
VTVDFTIRKAPEYKLATTTLKGKWPGDKVLQAEFEKLAGWAKAKGIRTGKWLFSELEEMDVPEEKQRYLVGIEVRSKGPVRGGKGVSIKTIPASVVGAITFDPDVVSPRVIYHGLNDWLHWHEKEKKYRVAGPFRELYTGNPWSSKKAWAHTQVQVPLKKLGA